MGDGWMPVWLSDEAVPVRNYRSIVCSEGNCRRRQRTRTRPSWSQKPLTTGISIQSDCVRVGGGKPYLYINLVLQSCHKWLLAPPTKILISKAHILCLFTQTQVQDSQRPPTPFFPHLPSISLALFCSLPRGPSIATTTKGNVVRKKSMPTGWLDSMYSVIFRMVFEYVTASETPVEIGVSGGVLGSGVDVKTSRLHEVTLFWRSVRMSRTESKLAATKAKKESGNVIAGTLCVTSSSSVGTLERSNVTITGTQFSS